MKVAIALSGGIDSAVAGLILKEKNYDLIGLTFEIFDSQKETISKAQKIAEKLQIPHYIIDLKKIFKEKIISYFINSYREGKTPNPCALCNKLIKFGKVFEFALKEFKINAFATGHYIKKEEYKGFLLLKRAKEKTKDQSYFLSLVDSHLFPFLIFPLGELNKEEVKKLAEKLAIPFEIKKSQDICFLKNKSLKEFLSSYLPFKKGPVMYKNKLIGTHPGIYFFTIGQRRGLGIPAGKPLYIIELDPIGNKIILGEEKELFSKGLVLEDLNFHLPLKYWTNPCAQIRYKSSPIKIKDIIKQKEEYLVLFEKEAKSVTPGQICAFYEEDFLLGGGIIKKAIKD